MDKGIKVIGFCPLGSPNRPARDVTREDVSDMELLEKAERNCRLVKGQVFLWPDAKSWKELWDE